MIYINGKEGKEKIIGNKKDIIGEFGYLYAKLREHIDYKK